MNDPVLRNGKVYDPLLEDLRHSTGSHKKLRNTYANDMARATQDGWRALKPGVRPFVLTRPGFPCHRGHPAVGAPGIERPDPVSERVARGANEEGRFGAHSLPLSRRRGLSCVGSGAEGSWPSA